MIKTVNNKAEYEALDKDSFESSVVYVRADNEAEIDGLNVVVNVPERGDIVALDENKDYKFLRLKTFRMDRLSTAWEIVGIVARVEGDDVLVVHKTNTSQKFSNVYRYRLSGYVLDSTERTGVLNLPQTASATSLTAYTFHYKAGTIGDFIEQINEQLAADENLAAQDWMLKLNAEDADVDLYCYLTDNYQRSATGTSGFKLTANLWPWFSPTAKVLRLNANRGGEGAISNWDRALTHFRNDNSSTSYNPASDVTSVKISYPICLLGYLGTSNYQSDHCAYLRSVYGEGEQGWLKFMESMKPVWPQSFGSFADKYNDGLGITRRLASEPAFVRRNGTALPASPMATYAQGIGYNCDGLRLGEWHVMSPRELHDVIDGVHYNTTNNRKADVLNEGLYAIGGSAISNGSSIWSCCRRSASNGWYSNGSFGFFHSIYLYISYVVVPVSHLKVRKHE